MFKALFRRWISEHDDDHPTRSAEAGRNRPPLPPNWTAESASIQTARNEAGSKYSQIVRITPEGDARYFGLCPVPTIAVPACQTARFSLMLGCVGSETIKAMLVLRAFDAEGRLLRQEQSPVTLDRDTRKFMFSMVAQSLPVSVQAAVVFDREDQATADLMFVIDFVSLAVA